MILKITELLSQNFQPVRAQICQTMEMYVWNKNQNM